MHSSSMSRESLCKGTQQSSFISLCYFYSPSACRKQTIKSTMSDLETIQHRSQIYYAVFIIRKKCLVLKAFQDCLDYGWRRQLRNFSFSRCLPLEKKKIKKFFEIAKKSIYSFNHFFCSMWEMSTAKPGHNMTTALYNINYYLGFTSQMPNFQHKMDCIPLNYLL